MRVLAGSLGLFAAALLAHLVLWRVRPPVRHIRALLRIYALVLAAGLPLLVVGATTGAGRSPACEALHAAAVFIALALAYTVTYTAVQVDSPSLVMIRRVAAAGDAGLARRELAAAMTDELLVTPRLRDLVRDGVVAEADGRFRLTGKSIGAWRLVLAWRRLLGIAGKGG